jgi:CBS domain-containing protein
MMPEQGELTNVRDVETEDRGTVTVGTLNNRLVEITPEGPVAFEGDRDIDEEAKFTARNISLPDVGTVIGQVDEQGRVFYRGQEVTDQAQFAPQRVEQGEPGAFGATQKQEFDIRSARVAAQNYSNTAEDAIALLEESPDVNTFVGRAASVANSLQAEGKAIARAAGVEFDESILEPSNYSSQFEDLGINNRRLQGIITSGAFQAAAASGQTGRSVSDKDMQRFIGEFGANASDPQAFAATLRDSVNRTVRNLRNRSEELYGEDLGEGITFMGEPIGFTQAELRERETRLSREDAIKQLPDDATLGKQDPKTGAWQVYRDGKIIGEIRPD